MKLYQFLTYFVSPYTDVEVIDANNDITLVKGDYFQCLNYAKKNDKRIGLISSAPVGRLLRIFVEG